MRSWRFATVVATVGAAVVLLSTGSARAHPLGNFTVNRFAALELFTDEVVVHYVVDMAEIPTFQQLSKIDETGGDSPSAERLTNYSSSLGRRLLDGITLTADGRDVPLTLEGTSATLRSGQGGLEVMRIEARLAGPLLSGESIIFYRDRNYAERIGWKEIVAYASGGQGIKSSSVPSRSISDALRAYPKDVLSSPPSVSAAQVEVEPGAASSNPTASIGGLRVTSPGALGGSLATSFAALIQRDLSPMFGLFALGLALVAGAVHALGPGHGKSIMAAYLVGTEGRIRHAVAVGAAVSLMHTASVVALGVLILGASRLFSPEAVFPWLSLLSGAIVLSLGVWLFRARLASRRHARAHHARVAGDISGDHLDLEGHGHGHEHGGHDDLGLASHGHAHEHGGHHHVHGDAARAVAPTSWKGLGVIALSGGLLPSPSALVVLLGAVALHRVVFGLVLVGTFSVGLAAALTAVGILVIRARGFAARRFGERLTATFPILSAAAIFGIGLFITAGAVARL